MLTNPIELTEIEPAVPHESVRRVRSGSGLSMTGLSDVCVDAAAQSDASSSSLCSRRSLLAFGAGSLAMLAFPDTGTAQTGVSASGLPAGASGSASFPSRPLRLLVGFSAGGGADAIARTLAGRLATQLGQNARLPRVSWPRRLLTATR